MRLSEITKGLSLACLLLSAPASLAQDDEELEVELFFAPAETVTSAARHSQPLMESPSAVTVLTREDIEASGARTLPEVLRLVPGMDIYMLKPMWYSVGVRSRTTEASDTVQLLINGRDVTMEFFGFPAWAVYPFSMDEVERIEVIRGPGSALYGSNAFSGIVHVITRQPDEGPLTSFSIRGGEHGQSEIGGRGRYEFGPLDLAASINYVKEDQWTSRDISGKDLVRGHLGAKIDLGERADLAFEAGSFYGSGVLVTDLGPVNLNDALNAFGLTRFTYDDLEVQVVFDHYEFDLDLDMKLFYPEVGLTLARIPSFRAKTDKLSLQAQHGINLFHNQLTYGAEYIFNRFFGEAVVPNDQHEHRFGIYLQDEIDFRAIFKDLADTDLIPIILTAGLRFDFNSITENYELSPRAALVCTPSQQHSFRFGYAHAFLKPTFLESSLTLKLSEGDLGDVFDQLSPANPELDNQRIDSIELGYAGNFFDNMLVLRIDLAYNWNRNQVWFKYDPEIIQHRQVGPISVPDISQPGPGMRYENDQSGHHGHNVEVQVIVRPTEFSRFFFQAGYRQVFDSETGLYSHREPVFRFSSGVDLSSRFGLTLSVRGYYSDSFMRDLPNAISILEPSTDIRIPATFLLNARVSMKFSIGSMNLSTGIEAFNLLDSLHWELAGQVSPNGPDLAAERLSRRFVLFLQGQL
jgi:outer membrane receptor protein involved in Fe transport